MAEQNPIKYSELISPDDSITRLISQLETLQTTYNGMAESIQERASSITASLKVVSGATEAGRKGIREASDEAVRLERAYKQLDQAMGENAKIIASLNEAKRQANNYNKNMVKLGGEEIKTIEQITKASYNQLSAQYSLNKAYINNLSAKERETKANKQFIETTKEIYEQMKRLQEATGKYALNVGNYTNSITQAVGINSRWLKGMQEIAALTEGGLTNGLKTAGSAVGAFGKSLLALLANPIVLTITAIAAAFAALAKGISTSEENTNALNRVLAPFKRILTEVVDVLQTAAEFVLKVVEGFENLAMGASRLMERLPLVGSAIKKVNDALQTNIDLTIRKQNLEKAERSNTVEQAKLARDVAMYRNLAATTKDAATKEMALKMARRGEQKIMENEIRLAKEDLVIKKAIAAQAGNDKQANDELAAAQARLYKAEENYYQKTLRINKQLSNMDKGGSGGGGRSGKVGAASITAVDLAKQQLEETRKMEDARIALIEDANLRERMTIIASYNRKIEDLKGSEEYITEMKLLLEQQREQKLAQLFEKEAKEQREREEKDLQERLKATDKLVKEYQERMAREAEEAKKGKDIYSMLGLKLTDDEKQKLEDGISEAFSFAISQLQNYMDALVQAADKKVQLAERDVETARIALDAEIEARNNGYASNVAAAQKELELAKRTQQKALQEQQRAQKAQQAVDTAIQTSSLITASANLWSSMSKVPVVGPAMAIAAIALMWSSFAAAKIKAAQVTRGNDEQYGEGTVELLEGGNHQSGNDIDLGRKRNGQRRRAEGGEFFAVINKRNSRRFRHVIPDVINAFNDGTFAQKYSRAYDDGGLSVTLQGQQPDLRGLSDDVRMIRQQGEQSSSFDANGNEVIRYKNLRRIIKS